MFLLLTLQGARSARSRADPPRRARRSCVHFNGTIEISHATDLTSVTSDLQSVSGRLSFRNNSGLASVVFPQLASLGDRLDLVLNNDLA